MNRSLQPLWLAFLQLCVALVLLFLSGGVTSAQGETWSEPRRVSSLRGVVESDPGLVADPFGYVHLFWSEVLPNERSIIQYARLEDEAWSVPNDIHVTEPTEPIKGIAPSVDSEGTLHLIWTQGVAGRVFYSRAPIEVAQSVQAWEPPRNTRLLATDIRLQVAQDGTIHMLFTRISGEPGVYHTYSSDQGSTWSVPRWLDPDILPGYVPGSIDFVLDSTGGLHALWFYKSPEGSSGDWVRYTHALEGSTSWTYPVTIARNGEGEPELNAFARPIMMAQGETVHVVWAAGDLLYRHHRVSTDRGQNWGPATAVFGELNGQAGDGLALDALGRLHFFGQIRFPQGIYHAAWNGARWTNPVLVYLIRYSSDDDYGGQIHAHRTFPVVHHGNHLVLSLTDDPTNPERGLYIMQHTLEGVPTVTAHPVPTTTPVPLAASPTPFPLEPTPTRAVLPAGSESSPAVTTLPSPGNALWVALIPSVLLLGVTVVGRWWFRR